MSLFTEKIKFTLPSSGGHPVPWLITVNSLIKEEAVHYTIKRNNTVVMEETRPLKGSSVMDPQHFSIKDINKILDLEIGYISLMKMGCIIRENEQIIHRTHTKPFRKSGRIGRFLDKMEKLSDDPKAPTPEELQKLERAKALRPSIAIDLALGVIFFFIAREYGLLSAALAGSGVTLILTIIDRFVKVDLLGGFAVLGVVMAMISAGLTYFFQDDLFIKLRGTLMGTLGASFALFDGIILKGNYLGKRMALYMEGLFTLRPQRASFAIAGASFAIMLIDTPLVFLLTTDQWIWYNSFLDSLIAIPLIIGAMYYAREPNNKN